MTKIITQVKTIILCFEVKNKLKNSISTLILVADLSVGVLRNRSSERVSLMLEKSGVLWGKKLLAGKMVIYESLKFGT